MHFSWCYIYVVVGVQDTLLLVLLIRCGWCSRYASPGVINTLWLVIKIRFSWCYWYDMVGDQDTITLMPPTYSGDNPRGWSFEYSVHTTQDVITPLSWIHLIDFVVNNDFSWIECSELFHIRVRVNCYSIAVDMKYSQRNKTLRTWNHRQQLLLPIYVLPPERLVPNVLNAVLKCLYWSLVISLNNDESKGEK